MKYELIKQHKNASLMIFIHGFGANRYDLLGLSKFFPDVNIISLEAPYNFNTQQSFWYDIQWIGDDKIINTDQAIQSKNLLINFIENEIEIIDPDFKKDNIFLLGFSQGAILSYAITSELKYIKRVYGLSGYIDENITTINGLNNNNLAIFACHGTADEVIPISKAREAKKILSAFDLGRYSYIEHNEGHWISQDILTEIIKWHIKND